MSSSVRQQSSPNIPIELTTTRAQQQRQRQRRVLKFWLGQMTRQFNISALSRLIRRTIPSLACAEDWGRRGHHEPLPGVIPTFATPDRFYVLAIVSQKRLPRINMCVMTSWTRTLRGRHYLCPIKIQFAQVMQVHVRPHFVYNLESNSSQ